MGCELGQEAEWSHERSIDWESLADPNHQGVQTLVGDLNRVYREHAALWQQDSKPEGFSWIDPNDVDDNALSFVRWAADGRPLVCLCNFSPVPRSDYRIGLPTVGRWVEVLNTDSRVLRRHQRRQHGRGRVRGDRVGRPAGLGPGHPAAPGHRLARSGVSRGSGAQLAPGGPRLVEGGAELGVWAPKVRSLAVRAGGRTVPSWSAEDRGVWRVTRRGGGRRRRLPAGPGRRAGAARPALAVPAPRGPRPVAAGRPGPAAGPVRHPGASRIWSSTSCTAAPSPPRAPSTRPSGGSATWPTWA